MILVLAALLLLTALPISATDSGEETPPPIYDTHYDETAGELSVYMHIVNAERGNLDLLPLLREAAASKACVDIDAGPVKIYLSAPAVKALAESGKDTLILLIKDLSPEEVREPEEDAEERTEMLRYRISIGDNDVSLPSGSLRVRFRYKSTRPALSNAYRVTEDGTEELIKSVYVDNVLSFYTPTLGEFVVHERPIEKGVPKAVYLSLALSVSSVILSAALAVLIATGRLKRLYLKRIGKE